MGGGAKEDASILSLSITRIYLFLSFFKLLAGYLAVYLYGYSAAIDLRFDFSRPKMETRARAAQMIRRGVLRGWDVCLLCFFGSLVA